MRPSAEEDFGDLGLDFDPQTLADPPLPVTDIKLGAVITDRVRYSEFVYYKFSVAGLKKLITIRYSPLSADLLTGPGHWTQPLIPTCMSQSECTTSPSRITPGRPHPSDR